MNKRSKTRVVWLLLIAVPLIGSTVRAQEEAPVETAGSRLGNLYINLESWVAQPTGTEYFPATYVDFDNPSATTALEIPHGTDAEVRYRFEYALPSEWGSVEFSVYKHQDIAGLSRLTPALFNYGEIATYPLFAGVYNNGLADGFASQASTRLREWRLDFTRAAFRSPRVSADWFVGWRRVKHGRALASEYYALVPDFPPLLPPNGPCPVPCPLTPLPDRATIRSQFEGRGATVGMDLEFPLWKNKVLLEGDIAISVMRGDSATQYSATNHVYILDLGDPEILDPPYDYFDDLFVVNPLQPPVPLLNSITQVEVPLVLQTSSVSSTSQVFETSLGFRWRTPWKWLEVYGGIRQAHYDNVGVDLRPKSVVMTLTEDGDIILNTQDIDRIERSATYEGLYGGLRIRLY